MIELVLWVSVCHCFCGVNVPHLWLARVRVRLMGFLEPIAKIIQGRKLVFLRGIFVGKLGTVWENRADLEPRYAARDKKLTHTGPSNGRREARRLVRSLCYSIHSFQLFRTPYLGAP